ncbi:hypothetical protein RHMOL_Rhmol10G0286900 [Rhododendron molle]|uniref:Uncharacterized protein n=1 Tax=Rhododendron molle TaxID=49168 RepID=A0ACC0M938_RHOML|nr:hypothetical protein RHMOL_Rhmol10G0286900 [Rhododendron molle]
MDGAAASPLRSPAHHRYRSDASPPHQIAQPGSAPSNRHGRGCRLTNGAAGSSPIPIGRFSMGGLRRKFIDRTQDLIRWRGRGGEEEEEEIGDCFMVKVVICLHSVTCNWPFENLQLKIDADFLYFLADGDLALIISEFNKSLSQFPICSFNMEIHRYAVLPLVQARNTGKDLVVYP